MPVIRFQNFTSAERKVNMLGFSMFPSTEDLGWIDNGNTLPANGGDLALSPTPNGVLLIFTANVSGVGTLDPAAAVFRNGLLQEPGADYTLSGSTITFVSAPLVDDIFKVIF